MNAESPRDNRLGHVAVHLYWAADKPTQPGWTDIRRTVQAHSFYYVHEGKGTFTTPDRVYEVEAGMAFYLKPGLHMDMASDGQEPLQMTMMLTDIAEMPRSGGWWTAPVPVEVLDVPFLHRCSEAEAKELTALLRNIVDTWVPGAQGESLALQGSLLRLLDAVHRFSGREREREPLPQAFDLVKTHLERYYHEDVKLNELAARYRISGSYLRKLFLAQLGLTPKSYLSRIRNEHARRFLLHTNASMKEIAQSCGYPDEYHFSKTFKQLNGMPPTAFRSAKREPMRDK